MSERGTEVALFDYARFNRDILRNESLILFNGQNPHNNKDTIARFRSEFETIGYQERDVLDGIPKSEGCDLLYVIKHGTNDGIISKTVPTMVHAVFPAAPREVHGASYAFVSQWLSDYCSNGLVSSVPHVVSIGNLDGNIRDELNIPEEATVFGCYGGNDSFSIKFVKYMVIPEILERRKDVYFIFMNIDTFMHHNRVRFLPRTVDVDYKALFVNSCDAMLHARRIGETFGLACGEFSLAGKPVITFSRSPHRGHIQILDEDAILYRDRKSLLKILLEFEPTRQYRTARQTYLSNFNPGRVIDIFERNLINPAIDSRHADAKSRLAEIRCMDLRYRFKEKFDKFRFDMYKIIHHV
jgi:hypothetical protein